MEYVKPKIHDETNLYQGIDLNDKKAVQKEFNKRRRVHSFFTIVFIVIFCCLGVLLFDFYRVNFKDGKPLIAVKELVDGGSLYKGIGYEVLYCDDGSRYSASVIYDSCNSGNGEEKVDSFNKVLYDSLLFYGREKKFIDIKNLDNLTINEYTFDETNDQNGSDYLLDLSISCKNDKDCFKTTKEFADPSNIKVIVRLDKANTIYDMVYFKETGAYNKLMEEQYTEKVKQYLIDNGSINLEDLRLFSIRFIDFNGKHTFRNVDYNSSYLISISYMCYSSENDCVKQFERKDLEGDVSNMFFQASLFLDSEGEVGLVGYKEYLGLKN